MAQAIDVKPAARKVEPRLARALAAAMERLRERPEVSVLIRALRSGNYAAARRALAALPVEDVLTPPAKIVQDQFAAGGKVGERRVV